MFLPIWIRPAAVGFSLIRSVYHSTIHSLCTFALLFTYYSIWFAFDFCFSFDILLLLRHFVVFFIALQALIPHIQLIISLAIHRHTYRIGSIFGFLLALSLSLSLCLIPSINSSCSLLRRCVSIKLFLSLTEALFSICPFLSFGSFDTANLKSIAYSICLEFSPLYVGVFCLVCMHIGLHTQTLTHREFLLCQLSVFIDKYNR